MRKTGGARRDGKPQIRQNEEERERGIAPDLRRECWGFGCDRGLGRTGGSKLPRSAYVKGLASCAANQ